MDLPNLRTVIKGLLLRIFRRLLPKVVLRLERLDDWAQLRVYQAENQALPQPQPGESRIVFLGDSITEFWDLAVTFPHKSYINRGISGQTTAQMLLRFRPDVIALKPQVVVILAGINDIAGNTGPMTLEMIQANYASMAQLAQCNHIRVIFASILPIHDQSIHRQSVARPPIKIRALNSWLKQYCVEHHHLYLDYYRAMANDQGMLKTELSEDGVHPNLAGYGVMALLVETAIQSALDERVLLPGSTSSKLD